MCKGGIKMHSKVIIASLVFGLSIGFAAATNKSASTVMPKKDETAYRLQKQENNPAKGAAAKVPVIMDGGGTHTHVYNSSYDYRNDAYHYANCACGQTTSQEHVFDAFYPNGHGHNDMIHCSLCDSNIWMTAMRVGNTYADSFAAQSAKWYYFAPEYSGTYIFETTGTSDTYGELYLGNFPTTRTTYNDDGGVNNNFRITIYLNANDNVFLRVRGWSWRAASYSLTVSQQAHVHNYNQLVNYDYQTHRRVCSCGDYISEPHAYNSYQAYNNVDHKRNCVCGRSIYEEHTFSDYLPYGHGHNDLIYCSGCQNNIECKRLEQGISYSEYVSAGNANWYIFIAQEQGTYVFETTGSADTYGYLYVGDYPSGTPIPNDDGGENCNFRISQYLDAGDIAFLKVREYDWENADYSISVVKEPEVIQPEPFREWTIMIYACGSTLTSFESSNISDIINVPNQPSDVNVIIETGGSLSSWGVQDATGAYIPNNQITRYHLRNNNLYREADFSALTDANMGDQSTFESFLNWGFSRYPAERIGVILVNHGGGILGVCNDDRHDDDVLTNSETSAAFANAFAANGINYNLEFIGYDACMMQLQDVAEFNSHYFNYMLASQIPTSELGWNYVPLIENIYNHSVIESNPSTYPDGVTLTALKQTARSFITNGYSWEQTLSVLDLTQMASYLNAFEQLADSVIYRIAQGALSTFNIQNGVLFTSDVYGENSYGNGDCIEMLQKLEEETDSGLLPRINAVRAFFPNNGDYTPYYRNTTINGCEGYTIIEGNGLVRYYAASLGRAGNPPITHGLAVCVGVSPSKLDDRYPASETNFTRWRDVVLATEDPHICNFTQVVPYDNTYHKRVCECGTYYYQQHSFNYTQIINGHEYAHCSVCNAMIDISNTPTPMTGN